MKANAEKVMRVAEPSPSYPWRSYRVLRTHDFIERTNGQSVPFRIFHCRTCERRFKFDTVTHATFAIASDAADTTLPSAVGERWVAERCPGQKPVGKR